MAKLNDTQLVILSSANRRRDFSVYPLPRNIKRGDGPKVLKQLLSKEMIEEVEAVGDAPVWRQHEDGYGVTLVLADGGFRALGVEREAAEPVILPQKPKMKPTKVTRSEAGSKQDRLVELLRSKNGTTIAEIAQVFGWLPHTARAVITVSVKRKLGLAVSSERVNGRGRVYHILKPSQK